jgi:hypothetical protein
VKGGDSINVSRLVLSPAIASEPNRDDVAPSSKPNAGMVSAYEMLSVWFGSEKDTVTRDFPSRKLLEVPICKLRSLHNLVGATGTSLCCIEIFVN